MMPLKQDPRRRQIQGRHVSICSFAKRKRSQVDISQTGKRIRYLGSQLPEDIWCHICSFLPLKDAARAACVSHSFERSWRCRPNLTFNNETMGYKKNTRRQRKTRPRDYNSRVDHILRNHSGTGMKTLRLEFYGPYDANSSYCLDSWLQTAVSSGIEELSLKLYSNRTQFQLLDKAIYNFPCSLLSDGGGNSIRELHLSSCAFRPTVVIGSMRNLTRLFLGCVAIDSDELGFLLSNSFALEQLELSSCREIISINIPSLLRCLSCLKVSYCCKLQVIESKAPNISTFHFLGDQQVELFLGEALQMKEISISHSCALNYARALLPSSTPNLETLTIGSHCEMVSSTPMLPSKFLHLKYLDISINGWAIAPAYVLFSLVSFLDASPCLETLNLQAPMRCLKHDSIFKDPSQFGRIPGQCYVNLRRVKIISFFSTNLLVKLTCHILENTPSLECLTLDMTDGGPICSDPDFDKCYLSKDTLVEAHKALAAIRTYMQGKVPSTAKLNVLEPCSQSFDY